jgi:hypothetical protein
MIRVTERRAALLIAVGVHLVLLVSAAFIHLREVEKTERRLYFILTESEVPPEPDRKETKQRVSTPLATRPILPPSGPHIPVHTTKRDVAELDVAIPASDSQRVWIPPRNILDADISPEQAWTELTRLIEEYPQYRDMVVREMLAGSGFVRDSLPPVSFRLEDVMKFEKFVPSWVYEAARVQGSYGGYNPVLGYRRSEQYTGPQLNVFQALKFLIDLIEGD